MFDTPVTPKDNKEQETNKEQPVNKEQGLNSETKSFEDRLASWMIANLEHNQAHNEEVDAADFKRSQQVKPYTGKKVGEKPQPPSVEESPFTEE
jgi:hypothetical protein